MMMIMMIRASSCYAFLILLLLLLLLLLSIVSVAPTDTNITNTYITNTNVASTNTNSNSRDTNILINAHTNINTNNINTRNSNINSNIISRRLMQNGYIKDNYLYETTASHCQWKHPSTQAIYPEVYWINMDSSVDRGVNMHKHFQKIGFKHQQRIRGVTMKDIYLPNDVELTWNHHVLAKYESEEDEKEYGIDKAFFVSSLFGRKHKNRLKELGCTMSHLFAIRAAIYSRTATSKYALIVEDDVQFPFDIDYEALIRTAPEDAGILQLFNSCEDSMVLTFNEYKKFMATHKDYFNDPTSLSSSSSTQDKSRNNVPLWRERFPSQHLSFWSTCAFLINREVLRPIIDQILVPIPPLQTTSLRNIAGSSAATNLKSAGVKSSPSSSAVDSIATKSPLSAYNNSRYDVKIIAGLHWPCTPVNSPCCITNTTDKSVQFTAVPPCIWAPKGYQADSYIYALVKRAYVFTLPLITNGMGGNESTFHQDHVLSIHFDSFQRQRSLINELLLGNVPLPPFIKPACYQRDEASTTPQFNKNNVLLLPPMAKVEVKNECVYEWVRQSVVRNESQPNKNNVAISAKSFLTVIALTSADTLKASARLKSNVKSATTDPAANGKKISSHYSAEMPDTCIEHYHNVFGTSANVHVLPIVPMNQMNLPPDISKYWTSTRCKVQAAPNPASTVSTEIKSLQILSSTRVTTVSSPRGQVSRMNNWVDILTGDLEQMALNRTFTVSGLCGRDLKRNSLEDLSSTVSHLSALLLAVRLYQQNQQQPHQPKGLKGSFSTSFEPHRFALIVEDDVQFPFDMDIQQLIASAPPGFAMLQLGGSDHIQLMRRYRAFNKDRNTIWDGNPAVGDSFATAAYLVDVAAIAPVISKIVSAHIGKAATSKEDNSRQSSKINEVFDLKIIAGVERPCFPAECCTEGSFKAEGYCALAEAGTNPDSYLSSLFRDRTYVSTLPLYVTGMAGKLRSSNNIAVRFHPSMQKGFQTQRKLVNLMYAFERSVLPKFLRNACMWGVEANLAV